MRKLYTLLSLAILLLIPLNTFSQWNSDGLKLLEVMDKVSRYYVDSLNESEFVENTIQTMLHDLDPHSSYISKEDLKELSEQLNGEFEGIGISFNILNDTIFVISTIQGGPSERAGLLAGDRITVVDGELVAGIGISNSGVQKRLKGKKGTRVEITVHRRRTNEDMDFTLIRDKIPVYSLDASYMVNSEIGYIKLSRFSQTTAKEFERALKDLMVQGMQSLILDLSGNGGGYLRIAVELADHFLSGGRQIVYTEGHKVPKRDYEATSLGMFEEGRLVVMIDENSASASEIVSGAIQEWDRGVLVGRRSFGKGLVQQPFRLNDGSEMRLTIARYYTPTGRLIQKPYDEGFDDYAMDIINRFNSGELNSSDSILFPESEKYKTLVKGRVVYGGGGIMPDYFVPIDTTFFSPYYRNMINRGIFNRFLMQYVDENREKFEKRYPDFQTFKMKYHTEESVLADLISFSEEEGLSFVEEDWNRSQDQVALLFKAYIARDLWEIGDFYEIFNNADPIYKKAVEILEQPKFYLEKL